jgi:hypothetical protein
VGVLEGVVLRCRRGVEVDDLNGLARRQDDAVDVVLALALIWMVVVAHRGFSRFPDPTNPSST